MHYAKTILFIQMVIKAGLIGGHGLGPTTDIEPYSGPQRGSIRFP